MTYYLSSLFNKTTGSLNIEIYHIPIYLYNYITYISADFIAEWHWHDISQVFQFFVLSYYVSLRSEFHYDFRIMTMFCSSLPPVVDRRAHVLFPLFVFAWVQWCATHIVLCFCLFFFVLCTPCCQLLWIVHFLLALRYSLTFIYLVYHIYIYICCQFLWIFSNVYLYKILRQILEGETLTFHTIIPNAYESHSVEKEFNHCHNYTCEFAECNRHTL